MKKMLRYSLLISLFLTEGCKLASFKNVEKDKNGENSAEDGKGTADSQGTPDKPGLLKPELEVTVPSPEIKPGGETMQAKAKIKDGPENPPVTWTIKGPEGKADIGSIDQDGNYKSPLDNDKDFPVVITAVLKSDPTVTASTTIKVLSKTQIFTACTRNNVVFPILAQVYQILSTATQIPDFKDTVAAKKVTTVCMDKYAVTPRNFTDGFPEVPQIFEYFALQTTTILQISVEGDYTFQLNSDDGSRLIIDGKLIIDNDGLHQARGPGPDDSQTVGMKEAVLRLSKGDHPLSLDYFQGPKFRIALELKWKLPGATSFDYVPREAFK